MATTSNDVGITSKGVSNIKAAIKSYRENVKKGIDISASRKEYREAIRGTSAEKSFEAATTQLDTQLESFLSFLDNVPNSLDTIKSNYVSNDAESTFNFKD